MTTPPKPASYTGSHAQLTFATGPCSFDDAAREAIEFAQGGRDVVFVCHQGVRERVSPGDSVQTLEARWLQSKLVTTDLPLQHLRQLLANIEPDLSIHDCEREQIFGGEISRGGRFVRPTHTVLDDDGEHVGWGMSEADAVTDAVRRRFKSLSTALDRGNAKLEALKSAIAGVMG